MIDTNTLSMVFNTENIRHPDFSHVKNWIDEGRGVIVYGGNKYKTEISGTRFARLLRLLRDARKAVLICDTAVDNLEKEILKKTKHTSCDDQHIIALLGASKCPLLCSSDTRSFPFIKNLSLYPKKTRAVRIYSSARNKNLLKKYDTNKLTNVEI